MVPSTKDYGFLVKSMDLGLKPLQMDPCTMESGSTRLSTGTASTNGLTAESMMELGSMANKTATASTQTHTEWWLRASGKTEWFNVNTCFSTIRSVLTLRRKLTQLSTLTSLWECTIPEYSVHSLISKKMQSNSDDQYKSLLLNLTN